MMMKLGAVLLAAGRSERFGGNKLLADFDGRPMVCQALAAMQCIEAERFAAVVSCGQVAELARSGGFDVLENDDPALGQAHSVVIAAEKLQDMDALLFVAGDQPLLTGESLALLVRRFAESGKGIACLADETHRGNPAVFSRRYFPALLALSGDRGAKGILREHSDDLLVVACLHENELADADTQEALEAIRARAGK